MNVIGLTGPSGAGKTAVADLINWPAVNADAIARQVHKDPQVLAALCCAFGADIAANGMLNRALLASRAFCDPEKTKTLNGIMHPGIIKRIHEELSVLEAAGHPFCLLDAPLLFEADCYQLCHATVAVLARRDVRRNRIIERDGISGEAADLRIAAQPEDQYYISRCDHVIWNNGNICDLQQAVQKLIKALQQELH